MTDTITYANGTPTWVDLMTPDPEGARKFYGQLFGWVFDVGGPESGHYTMCKVRGKNAAGLGQMPKDAKFPSAWTTYFSTDNVDAAAKRVRDNGGNLMMEPMDVMTAGRMAIAIDPTGGAFGFWQPREHKGAQARGEHGAMAWHELMTRDLGKARDFYAKVLEVEMSKMDAPMEYYVGKKNDEMHFGLMAFPPEVPKEIPTHWLNYFRVDNTDASLAQLPKLGGKVLNPAMDSPYGRWAIVSDPFGASFAVIQPPAK